MCSGRIGLEFVLRAFSNGIDGVFVGGCRLNECNYITQGNYHALILQQTSSWKSGENFSENCLHLPNERAIMLSSFPDD